MIKNVPACESSVEKEIEVLEISEVIKLNSE